jgi:hypothetical protein
VLAVNDEEVSYSDLVAVAVLSDDPEPFVRASRRGAYLATCRQVGSSGTEAGGGPVPGGAPGDRVMERLGMSHDEDDEFDHPKIPAGHTLRPHVLYRLSNLSEAHVDGTS